MNKISKNKLSEQSHNIFHSTSFYLTFFFTESLLASYIEIGYGYRFSADKSARLFPLVLSYGF